MYKCDRCYDRIADGELPACIEQCPEDVQTIGPRSEIIKEAHRLADEEGVYIYGELENGGTNTIYLSPVPFEALNQAIEKGPGTPHFNPVEDQMAHADNLAKAMLLAPLAGLAAGVSRVYKATKKMNKARRKKMKPVEAPQGYIEQKLVKPIYIALIFLMGLTGFGQMPIFKRYYIADIPGLAWTAKYYITHYMHYIGATLLLALIVYGIVVYIGLLRKSLKLTWAAYIRITLLVAIVITGIFRVLKNLPDVVF